MSGSSAHLYVSVQKFEELGLKENLLKGVYNLGYQKPSKIQATALPLLLADPPKNMIGQSQAGTGKTACFSLNVLSRVDETVDCVQAICLAPARELARQILDNIREAVTGHVVVGTPGTVADLIKRRQLDVKGCRVFVLDEADSMLDIQGLHARLSVGLGDTSIRIKNMMPKSCQIVLFSATFPENVREFAAKVAPDAHSLALRQEEVSVDGIKQFYMDCKNEAHKAQVLCDIYGLLTIGQSIVFVRQRKTADMLHAKMEGDGHAVTSLHGNFEAADRDKAIDDFREGRSKVLITTNVLARGIDILQVNLVVNYDVPLTKEGYPDPETYVHRIGRTGRFGRQGVSINFVHDRQSYEEMKKIQEFMGRDIVRVPTDHLNEVEKILKDAL
ncbi:RNA helicase required for poly(A+) mRNA export [Kappamyces sp. JEL0829]|nr:RNA helicase required for poly(A+) mRNA export [Kappamyces sp. JEL0829]KAJ3345380.1 RNA helicase required for poly(A+) mRNA export [Kappamyces sp. JEL0680]